MKKSNKKKPPYATPRVKTEPIAFVPLLRSLRGPGGPPGGPQDPGK